MSIVQPLYDKILEVMLDKDNRSFMPNRQARRAVMRLLLEEEDDREKREEIIPDLKDAY